MWRYAVRGVDANRRTDFVGAALAEGGIGGLVLFRAYAGDDPVTEGRLYSEYRPLYDYRGNVLALVGVMGSHLRGGLCGLRLASS